MNESPLNEGMKERFLSRVNRTGDCWMWLGPTDRYGYGRHSAPEFKWGKAHRVSYELFVGPIPQGYEIDHTCHGADSGCPGGVSCPHRSCVNPSHLEAVTHYENSIRGNNPSAQNARKTHCDHGHEFTAENTRIYKGARVCRKCDSRRSLKYQASKRTRVAS